MLPQLLGTQVPAVVVTQVHSNPAVSVKVLQIENLVPSVPMTEYDKQLPAGAQVDAPTYLQPAQS